MRIGLFGGTFNPIHFGHIHVSKEIKDRFPLDQIIMIPAAIPPHKEQREIAEAQDRLIMTQIAVSHLEGYLVSDIEIMRSGPSYTIDTITHFKRTLSAETEPFLLLGMDAFLEINTWMSYAELFDELPLIVMSRPGTEHIGVPELATYIQLHISEKYDFDKNGCCFRHPEKQPVHLADVTLHEVSSTRIREAIRRRMSLQNMVPEPVERYIRNKGLYGYDS
jgi:nicotinate-nucleotide adenylyltransferase